MKRKIQMSYMKFFGMFRRRKDSSETVETIENMKLTLRGMRGSYMYIFDSVNGQSELRRYVEKYCGEETNLILEASVLYNEQKMIDLMNTCSVISWDGFHGKHPKNVQDGIMFDFSAKVNGGRTVLADGSANFPKGYSEFVRTLDEILVKAN